MQSNFMTETLTCDLDPEPAIPNAIETEFEKRRGVSHTEVRDGYAQVHVTNLVGDVMPARLRVLRAVADASVSIDFLKLTPSGLSFLVASDEASRVESALSDTGGTFSLRLDRSIVMIHAVNIRDEEGLIAMVMREAISEGTVIDHVGDMHDRVLLVVSEADAARLNRRLEIRLNEEVNLGN
jgi:aspartokinase